jgi:hypothetical protein
MTHAASEPGWCTEELPAASNEHALLDGFASLSRHIHSVLLVKHQ